MSMSADAHKSIGRGTTRCIEAADGSSARIAWDGAPRDTSQTLTRWNRQVARSVRFRGAERPCRAINKAETTDGVPMERRDWAGGTLVSIGAGGKAGRPAAASRTVPKCRPRHSMLALQRPPGPFQAVISASAPSMSTRRSCPSGTSTATAGVRDAGVGVDASADASARVAGVSSGVSSTGASIGAADVG